MHETNELWHVQFADSVRTLTIDQLDAAFQAGAINEQTMVLRAGTHHWTTLGAIAGIDESPNSLAPFAADVGASFHPPPQPMPSLDAASLTAEIAALQPKRRRAPAIVAALAVALAVGGGVFAAQRVSPLAATANAAAAVAPPAAVALPAAATTATPVPEVTQRAPTSSAATVDSRSVDTSKKRTKKSRGGAAPKKKGKSTDPIQKGGDAYDPLNGAL